jgi:hypothetical protein
MNSDIKLIPLKDIKDDHEFWRGTRFRIYNVGQNVKDKNDDYYEYMLAQIPGDNDHFLLTNVVGYKSGAALALVKTIDDKSKIVVTAKALKFSLGTEDTFVVVDEFV